MMRLSRRAVMQGVAAGVAAPAWAQQPELPTTVLPFENGARPIVQYPQKRPLLRLTTRPPQLETPFAVFNEGPVTPNDAFFVRYHLAGIPYDEIDPDSFRLSVTGLVERPQSLDLAALKRLEPTEVMAVNQCSGNSRGFFAPRVAGGQAGNGLMGNALWRGVRLRTVLEAAGVKAGAVEVKFEGMDGPVSPATPKFAKSLPLDVARSDDVLLAWAMNGADLPVLNGYPLRLVVPGYFGTYWLKHLNAITVLDKPLDNFWMATAYRVPDNDCQCSPPGQAPAKTRPIGQFKVRSFITSVRNGDHVTATAPMALRGIAFDKGTGIRTVEVSADSGQTWMEAKLGDDLGRYAFRPWTALVQVPPGPQRLMVRATSVAGEQQAAEPLWNPAGYARNVIESVNVVAG